MTILKQGVDGFSFSSIDFQLFYFLTRIIPVLIRTQNEEFFFCNLIMRLPI